MMHKGSTGEQLMARWGDTHLTTASNTDILAHVHPHTDTLLDCTSISTPQYGPTSDPESSAVRPRMHYSQSEGRRGGTPLHLVLAKDAVKHLAT